jgi:hypothetical protein
MINKIKSGISKILEDNLFLDLNDNTLNKLKKQIEEFINRFDHNNSDIVITVTNKEKGHIKANVIIDDLEYLFFVST